MAGNQRGEYGIRRCGLFGSLPPESPGHDRVASPNADGGKMSESASFEAHLFQESLQTFRELNYI